MFYVYRFLDEYNNIIYVGKSKQELEKRFSLHRHLPDECYNIVYKIEYIECFTETDMSIKEIYYINKYRGNQIFYNILDISEPPESVVFNDEWKMYKGKLDSKFPKSINYINGFVNKKVIKYNKDGSIDKRGIIKSKEKGSSSYVDGFTNEEVDLIIDYMIKEINEAENYSQEQIRFRNLVMFIMGINLPFKSNEFLCLKYRDIFDKNDHPKAIKFKLNRLSKDKIINVPLKTTVINVLLVYREKYGLNYENNSKDLFFQSRKHQMITISSWGRILKEAAETLKIDKNIGAESVRKTYGVNVYQKSNNKLNALLFLGELWGRSREAQVIKYLNLAEQKIDFNHYFGETYALGNINLSKIKCLNQLSLFNI